MKALDIITAALTNIGVVPIGESVPINFSNMALNELNAMLQLWSIEGMLVPSVTQETFTLTAAKVQYTIGITTPASDFNTAKPIKLVSAFIKYLDIDYEFDVYNNLNAYNSLSLKTTNGMPYQIHYDPDSLIGNIYFYPVPDADYSFYLTSEKYLTVISSVNEVVSLPPEYEMALSLHLAEVMMSKFGRSDSMITARAQIAKNALMTNNSKKYLSDADFDSALLVRSL